MAALMDPIARKAVASRMAGSDEERRWSNSCFPHKVGLILVDETSQDEYIESSDSEETEDGIVAVDRRGPFLRFQWRVS